MSDVLAACRLPSVGTTDFTPTEILRRASEIIWNWGTHQVAIARDGRMAVDFDRVVATSAINASADEFELPPMAVADTIDIVQWESSDGGSLLRLHPIPVAQQALYRVAQSTGTPSEYMLLDGRVRICPAPDSGGTLRITYQRRHGQLVIGSDTTVVSSVANSGGAPAVTLTSTPSSFVTNAWVDIVSQYYPYRIKVHGAKITNIAANVATFGNCDYDEFAAASLAGDTVVIYGKTPYVHLPLEMKGSITNAVATEILVEIGDPVATVKSQLAEAAGARTRQMLSPRIKADREKIVNPNSIARARARRRSSWWRQ